MDRKRTSSTVHRLAFAHYLRTGQRLTNDEWLTSQERKFNPYHDERGRFTSPPRASVSWGGRKRDVNAPKPVRRSSASSREPERNGTGDARSSGRATSEAGRLDGASSGFRSEFVRDATTVRGHAETYFELNKRQAGLDRLRAAAGPKPTAAVADDLQDIQKRLDADRSRLDARQGEINRQTVELLRTGLTPFDTAAGAFNVATGNGTARDYVSLVGAIPAGAVIRRVGGIIQIGGAESIVKKLVKTEGVLGVELHHVPSKSSLDLAGISIPSSQRPVIAQLVEDHRVTRSWGSWAKSQKFRREVAERITMGDVEGALKMEFDDLEKIKGGAYGHGAEDVARYIQDSLKKFKR